MRLIVVGFHRSGTSLLSQLLHTAGLYMGDELLGAGPSNPYGHFEDVEVMRLHQEILGAHGDSWQVDQSHLFHIAKDQWERMQQLVSSRDSRHRHWGFKDPRVCFFLGVWKFLIPDAKFIVTYRDPSDTTSSLERRHASEYFAGKGPAEQHLKFFTRQDHALRLWAAHYDAVISFAEQHRDDCLVMPTSYLHGGYPVVRTINSRFGCDLDEVPVEAVFDPMATQARPTAQWVHSRPLERHLTRIWSDLVQLTLATAVAS